MESEQRAAMGQDSGLLDARMESSLAETAGDIECFGGLHGYRIGTKRLDRARRAEEIKAFLSRARTTSCSQESQATRRARGMGEAQ